MKCLLTASTLIKLTCLPGFSVNGFSRRTRWTAICFVCHTPPPPPTHTHPPHTLDAIAVTQAAFGAGEGPVYLNGVRCLGNEANLLDCPSSGVGVQVGCTHSQDAGVYCTGEWKTGEGLGGSGRVGRGREKDKEWCIYDKMVGCI